MDELVMSYIDRNGYDIDIIVNSSNDTMYAFNKTLMKVKSFDKSRNPMGDLIGSIGDFGDVICVEWWYNTILDFLKGEINDGVLDKRLFSEFKKYSVIKG